MNNLPVVLWELFRMTVTLAIMFGICLILVAIAEHFQKK